MEDLRYPIGRFDIKQPVAGADRPALIDVIAAAPAAFRAAVTGLDDAQLDTPYREGGWTVRQLVHHVPDSHLNAYVRFKWTLTEDMPAIKTYDEKAWARLHDSQDTPVEVSLALLESLHLRWVTLLRGMDDAAWARALQHPDLGTLELPRMLGLYAWHGRHHTAHVTALRARLGW
jgi:uncharacterized damage-inducible protein DinB